MQFQYGIHPRKVALILGVIALILAAESLYTEFLVETYLGDDSNNIVGPVLDLFSVNLEESIPTWYSTLILFMAGILLAVIATAKRTQRARHSLYWVGLAAIFFYLSMDESAVVHEIVSDPLQAMFSTTGYLAFGWQILAAPLVVVFAIIYLRFLLHLPAGIRNRLILAAVLYVGGALIVDAVSANKWDQDNGISFAYLTMGTLEELLEMVGVVVLIYTLLRYLVLMQYEVTFRPRQADDTAAIVVDTPIPPDSRQAPSGRSAMPLRFVALVLIGVAAVVNGGFLFWARSEPTPAATPSQDSILAYQAILAQPGADQVVVTRLTGMFGIDPVASHEIVGANLSLFDRVIVVVLPSAASSLILAGDTLPFDQAALTDILRANGVAQFIIFDTPAVQQMTNTS